MAKPRNHRRRVKQLQAQARREIVLKSDSMDEIVEKWMKKAAKAGWTELRRVGNKVWGFPPNMTRFKLFVP